MIERNARDLEQMFTFADAAGIGSVFVLPWIVNAHQSREDAARVAAENPTELLSVTSHHKVLVCSEPLVHSWAESPALVRRLIDQTGIARGDDVLTETVALRDCYHQWKGAV